MEKYHPVSNLTQSCSHNFLWGFEENQFWTSFEADGHKIKWDAENSKVKIFQTHIIKSMACPWDSFIQLNLLIVNVKKVVGFSATHHQYAYIFTIVNFHKMGWQLVFILWRLEYLLHHSHWYFLAGSSIEKTQQSNFVMRSCWVGNTHVTPLFPYRHQKLTNSPLRINLRLNRRKEKT